MALETGWQYRLREEDATRTKRLNEVLTHLRGLGLTDVAGLTAFMADLGIPDMDPITALTGLELAAVLQDGELRNATTWELAQYGRTSRTALTAATALNGADVLDLLQAGIPRKFTLADLEDYLGNGGGFPNVSIMDFIPSAQHSAIYDGTSTYDCTTDIHSAIDAIVGSGGVLAFPRARFLVSEVTCDGADYSLATNNALFQQASGLTGDAEYHPIFTFPQSASGIRMGDVRLKGNIATDSDEWSPGIGIFGADNIKLGDVHGEDLRGDTLYCYGRNSTEAEHARNITTGVISGDNVLRCIVAVAGGDVDIRGIFRAGGVGYRDLDVEPNAASDYQRSKVRIGKIHGAEVQLTSASTSSLNAIVSIDECDLDGSRVANSSPGYFSHGGTNTTALAINRTDVTRIGTLRLRNYASYPISLFDRWKSITIDTLDFASCGTSETTYKAIALLQPGSTSAGTLNIGNVVGALAADTKMIFRGIDASTPLRINVGSLDVTNGLFGVYVTGKCGGGKLECGNPSGEIVFIGLIDFEFGPLTITNTTGAYGFYLCSNVTFNGATASTFSAGLDYGVGSTNVWGNNSVFQGRPRGTRPLHYGGNVTQTSSKTSSVTHDKDHGTITMHNASMAAGETVTFTFNNNTMADSDHLVADHFYAGAFGAYMITPRITAAGVASISVTNVSSVPQADAIILRFTVLRGDVG